MWDEIDAQQAREIADLVAQLTVDEVIADIEGAASPGVLDRWQPQRRRDPRKGSYSPPVVPRLASGRAAPRGREVDAAGRLVPVLADGIARRRGGVPARLRPPE